MSEVVKAVTTAVVGVAAIALGPPGWVGAAVAMAATMATSIALNTVFPAKKPSIPGLDFSQFETGNYTRMIRQPITSRRIIYGECRVSGPITFLHTTDNNKYLHMLITVSSHEIDSFQTVYINDEALTLSGNDVTSPSKYNGKVKVYTGTGSTAGDGSLLSALQTDCPDKWTTDHKQQGCAKIYVRLQYDRNVFSGVPEISAVIRGKNDISDPRGAGSEGYTTNWALCCADYITNYLGDTVDEDDLIAAANVSDEDVNLAGGGTEDRYTVNGVIDTADEPKAILGGFKGAGAAFIYYANGKWRLKAGAYAAPTQTITIDDLDGPITGMKTRLSRRDLCNRVKGVYVSPENDWQPSDFPPVTNATYLSQDQGEELWRDIDLPLTTSSAAAQRLAKIELEKHRQQIQVTLPLKLWPGINIEIGEVVQVTLERYGWTNKIFEVVNWSFAPRGEGDNIRLGVDLFLRETATTVYDWNSGEETEIDPAPDTDFPATDTPPPEIENPSVSEEQYPYRRRRFTRIKVSFDAPDFVYFDHAEVWVSVDGGTTYNHHTNVSLEPGATGNFQIDPVEELEDYYIKIYSVSERGVKSTNFTLLQWTVSGYDDDPSDMGDLRITVNDNGVNIIADDLEESDIDVYELRMGPSWSGGVLIATNWTPNWFLKSIKPGSHTLWGNSKANNERYGANPASGSITVQDPPDHWTVQAGDTQTDDYSGGTHSNTEQITYNTEDYLKCSHTSGVLTGTYTSSIFDLGSSDRYLVYILADLVVTGEGTTWADILNASTSWASNIATGSSWSTLFALSEGPSVSMKLKYGETSPPTNEVEGMEIFSVIVTGRYFQVEINITDPRDGVNALVEHFTLKFCQ